MAIPLILTRPSAQSEEFAAQVETALPGKFSPLISPLFEITPEPVSLDLTGVQALLFTSRNGVAEFVRRSTNRSIPALCVGEKTAKIASQAGLNTSFATGDVAALAALAVQSYLPDFGTLLHFRGTDSVGDLVGALNAEGVSATERILYDTSTKPLTANVITALKSSQPIVLPVFSPRTAALLSQLLQEVEILAKPTLAALSRNVADRIDLTTQTRILIAEKPTALAMVAVLSQI